ncbi:MAG: hypothetical protein HOP02_02310 [Methylococcaceae bacterium]|nr:hypothetical protein [Methylococcaceae bacterium]
MDFLDNYLQEWNKNMATLLRFIEIAEEYGMPVKLLRRVNKNYTIQFMLGTGTDATETFFNNLYLYADTVHGLQHSSKVRASEVSVQTLYHEATHAFIDIVDADETSMFKNAVSEYKNSKLKNGKTVDDPERVAHEAAAGYVGHRASTLWMVGVKITLLTSLLDSIATKQLTKVKGEQLIEIVGSIPDFYNREMQKRVFGYQMVGSAQVGVANQPIPQQLQAYCDGIILENKIKNSFNLMKMFGFSYEPLQRHLDCGV